MEQNAQFNVKTLKTTSVQAAGVKKNNKRFPE